jgi:hypothetical protein
MGHQIESVHEPERWFAAQTFHSDAEHVGQVIGPVFGAVAAYLGRRGVPCEGPAVSRYRPEAGGFEVAAGFAVDGPFPEGDGVRPERLPETDALATLHTGAYTGLPGAYADLEHEARVRGVALDPTAMWEEYLDGPDVPQEQTRTRIVWPLVEAGRR